MATVNWEVRKRRLNEYHAERKRISYADSASPDQLSPSEASQVIAHYSGSITEYKTGEFHVCHLCRPHLVREYFRRFNTMTEADAQDLQELDAQLSITEAEYNTNAQALDRASADLYATSPF